MENRGSSQSLGNAATSSNFWTQPWLLSLENAAASAARMGTTDPFILQRRREQGHNAKHSDFSMFLGQTGGKQKCQQSKEGNPNTLGAAFRGAPAKFEIPAPEGFKIALPEAED